MEKAILGDLGIPALEFGNQCKRALYIVFPILTPEVEVVRQAGNEFRSI